MNGGRRSRFTPEQVTEALREADGCQSEAARALGCSRNSIGRYIARDPMVRAAAGGRREQGARRAPAEVAAALEDAGGIEGATLALGCSRRTLRRLADRYPEVAEVYERVARRHKQYSDDEIAAAVRQAQGNLALAARALGCSRPTLGRYIRRQPELGAAVEQAREARGLSRPDEGAGEGQYGEQEVADAIREARGVLSRAARTLGCGRKQVTRLMERFPEAREAYEACKTARVGKATSKWLEAIDAGQAQAVHRALSRFGKSRGYRPVRRRRGKRRKSK